MSDINWDQEKNLQNSDSPIFLRKVFHMIDYCSDELVTWSQDGTSFTIKDSKTMSNQILPQYFKHNNFSSFVRQLNFYGFMKYKDDSNVLSDANSTEEEGKQSITFSHPHFQRDQPQLLTKIQRKASGSNSGSTTSNHLNTSTSTGLDTSTNDAKRKELEHEIKVLQGQLNNMESILNDLSQKMASVHLTEKDTMLVNHMKKGQYSSSSITRTDTIKVLIHDKELYDSKPPANKVQTKIQSKYPLSVADLKDVASVDLPDLGKIETKDSDLLDGEIIPRHSSRSASEDDRDEERVEQHQPMDISNSITEKIFISEDIDTSLEPFSDALHADQDQISASYTEAPTEEYDMDENQVLRSSPTLIQDDGDDEKSSCSSSESCLDTESSPLLNNHLLDEDHLTHLEQALRSLPMNERLAFVRKVLKEIPDISSQGFSVTTIHDTDKIQSSFNRNTVDLNYDDHMLPSQLENLLERVGLKIQIRGKDQHISTKSCSRSLQGTTSRKTTQKSNGSTKDSSFVRIEA